MPSGWSLGPGVTSPSDEPVRHDARPQPLAVSPIRLGTATRLGLDGDETATRVPTRDLFATAPGRFGSPSRARTSSGSLTSARDVGDELEARRGRLDGSLVGSPAEVSGSRPSRRRRRRGLGRAASRRLRAAPTIRMPISTPSQTFRPEPGSSVCGRKHLRRLRPRDHLRRFRAVPADHERGRVDVATVPHPLEVVHERLARSGSGSRGSSKRLHHDGVEPGRHVGVERRGRRPASRSPACRRSRPASRR